MINEIDGQLNKLTYIQNQSDSQLKNLISLSAHNYVLRQNQEVVKMNEIFVHKLKDMANILRNVGKTLEGNSFELIDTMSTLINDKVNVNLDFPRNISKSKKHPVKQFMFKCDKCSKSFSEKSSLNNHKSLHLKLSFSCSKCTKVLFPPSLLPIILCHTRQVNSHVRSVAQHFHYKVL